VNRLHLFEIHDYRLCPKSLRALVTDYIQYGVKKWEKMHMAIALLLGKGLERTGEHQIIDLCSGTGGPWPYIIQDLEQAGFPARVRLTDKYPNARALQKALEFFGDSFIFFSEPVDATEVPETLDGFRTVFFAFHHFRQAHASAILRDAVKQGKGIAIFEITQRTPRSIFIFLLTSLVFPFYVPFMRPLTWERLIWTYLIPIGTIVVLFDSLVSCLRTYSISELKEMTMDINAKGYLWEVGEVKMSRVPVPITYLLGYPDRP
jgi:hypothetical protein